jgi:hypothetical protein
VGLRVDEGSEVVLRISRDRERRDRRIVNTRIGMVNAGIGNVNTVDPVFSAD